MSSIQQNPWRSRANRGLSGFPTASGADSFWGVDWWDLIWADTPQLGAVNRDVLGCGEVCFWLLLNINYMLRGIWYKYKEVEGSCE